MTHGCEALPAHPKSSQKDSLRVLHSLIGARPAEGYTMTPIDSQLKCHHPERVGSEQRHEAGVVRGSRGVLAMDIHLDEPSEAPVPAGRAPRGSQAILLQYRVQRIG